MNQLWMFHQLQLTDFEYFYLLHGHHANLIGLDLSLLLDLPFPDQGMFWEIGHVFWWRGVIPFTHTPQGKAPTGHFQMSSTRTVPLCCFKCKQILRGTQFGVSCWWPSKWYFQQRLSVCLPENTMGKLYIRAKTVEKNVKLNIMPTDLGYVTVKRAVL